MDKALFSILFMLFTVNLPAAEDSDTPSTGDPIQGAKSWSDNCARCHEMRDPSEFRDDLWKPIMSHMRLRAGLTGRQTRDILAFLQASNYRASTSRLVSSAAVTGTAGLAEADGQAVYNQTCIACHGADGEGAIPGVADLTANDGPLSKGDAELLSNITNGFKSPDSIMMMPAKGGNPALSDAELRAALDYIREQFSE